jgi:hypothetical protein
MVRMIIRIVVIVVRISKEDLRFGPTSGGGQNQDSSIPDKSITIGSKLEVPDR